MPRRPKIDRIVRFFNKVDLNGPNGCYLWTGCKLPRGYGSFYPEWNQPKCYAHRWSYEYFKGEIPEGFQILHSCDNPSCVNPDHLSIGTRSDNMQDALNKNRFIIGEDHKNTNLKESDILTIYRSNETNVALAKLFNVHINTISRIRTGKRWKYFYKKHH